MNLRCSAKNLLGTLAEVMEHGEYNATSYVLERLAVLEVEVAVLRDALARANETRPTSGRATAGSVLPESVRGGSQSGGVGSLP